MIYLLAFNISNFFIVLEKITNVKLIKKMFEYLSALILIWILGFRFYVGTDYSSYVVIFNKISQLSFEKLLTFNDTEIAHNFLCKIIYELGFDSRILFVVYAVLIIYFIYKTMNKLDVNKFVFISTFVFMIFPYAFNIMRQVLAMVIVLYSFTYLLDNKKGSAFLFLALSISFHKPAIVILPVYICHIFIKNKKLRNILIISIYSLIVLLFMCNILTIFNIDAITRYNSYLNSTYFNYGLILTSLVKQLPIIFLFFLYRKKFTSDNINNYTYIAIFLLGFILLTLGALNPTLNRLSLYFTCFNTIIMGKVLNKKNCFSIKIIYYIYLVTYFLYQFYYSGVCEIFPYRTWVNIL